MNEDRSLLDADQVHASSTLLTLAALAGGGLLIGYAAYTLYKDRSHHETERERRLALWLTERLDLLAHTLRLPQGELKWFAKTIGDVVSRANRALRKADRFVPEALDEVAIEIEGALVKTKQRVHRELNLDDEQRLHALHEFYEEVRDRLVGADLLNGSPRWGQAVAFRYEPDYRGVNN